MFLKNSSKFVREEFSTIDNENTKLFNKGQILLICCGIKKKLSKIYMGATYMNRRTNGRTYINRLRLRLYGDHHKELWTFTANYLPERHQLLQALNTKFKTLLWKNVHKYRTAINIGRRIDLGNTRKFKVELLILNSTFTMSRRQSRNLGLIFRG